MRPHRQRVRRHPPVRHLPDGPDVRRGRQGQRVRHTCVPTTCTALGVQLRPGRRRLRQAPSTAARAAAARPAAGAARPASAAPPRRARRRRARRSVQLRPGRRRLRRQARLRHLHHARDLRRRGTPSVCGPPTCNPADVRAPGSAAPAADGCGGLLSAGPAAARHVRRQSTPSECGIPATCTGLCLQQVTCTTPAVTTTVTGDGVRAERRRPAAERRSSTSPTRRCSLHVRRGVRAVQRRASRARRS